MSTETSHYADVQWRLEVPVGSRRAAPATPQAPQFVLNVISEPETTKDVNTASATNTTAQWEEHWMTADYDTLLQVTRSLEGALKSLDSTEYRRVNRLVK